MSPRLPALILAAALIPSLAPLAAQLLAATPIPAPPIPFATLVLTAAAGRCLLALLPAGSPSNHPLTTWATSHLLGVILLSAEALIFKSASPLALAAPWLVLGLALFLTGPGDLAPRHHLAPSPIKGPLARALQAAIVLVALLPFAAQITGRALLQHAPAGHALGLPPGFGSQPLSGPSAIHQLAFASFPALLILVHHALYTASKAPAKRLAATLALAVLPLPFALITSSAPESAALPAALLAAAAATVFGAIALIRADRRAAHISLIASLSLAWLLPRDLGQLAPVLPAAGIIALLAAAPFRARIIKPAAAALAASIAIGILIQEPLVQAPTSAPFAPLFAFFEGWSLASYGALFFLADATALLLILRRPWHRPKNRPRPHLFFVFAIAALTFLFSLAALTAAQSIWHQEPSTWLQLAPSLLTLMAPSALLMVVLNADELAT